VTVDCEEPGAGASISPAANQEYFVEQAEAFFNAGWSVGDFTYERLPNTNSQIIENCIRSGLSGRKGVRFSPLVHFLYKDSNRMLTLGGMLTTDLEERKLGGCGFKQLDFLRRSLSDPHCEIKIPRLTRRERQFLDAAMPSAHGWKPRVFEISQDELREYGKIYRYFPAYSELLLP
jgi:hypothetical protein